VSQLLQEVETQAVLSQQKITQTQAELSAKRRDSRLNLLTANELKSLSKDTKTYEGVGKMYEAVFFLLNTMLMTCFIGSWPCLCLPSVNASNPNQPH